MAQQATLNNYLDHAEVEAMAQELIGCRKTADPATCRGQIQDKFQAINDAKTGAALYGCKSQSEANCNGQLTAARGGTEKLDWLMGVVALTKEEKDVLGHFQDINENDDRVAHQVWLESFWQESGAAGGVLLGGAAALAAGGKTATSTTTHAVKPNANLTSALTDGEAGFSSLPGGAKGTANTALKLGETQTINDVSMTRVGRWMSPEELAQMQSSNRVVQGGGGQTFISTNGAVDFKGAASKGSVYVELMFQVVDYCKVVKRAGIR